MRAGPGQHPAVPQEAAGSSPKVAAPGNESASTSGQQIAPEHPSDPFVEQIYLNLSRCRSGEVAYLS